MSTRLVILTKLVLFISNNHPQPKRLYHSANQRKTNQHKYTITLTPPVGIARTTSSGTKIETYIRKMRQASMEQLVLLIISIVFYTHWLLNPILEGDVISESYHRALKNSQDRIIGVKPRLRGPNVGGNLRSSQHDIPDIASACYGASQNGLLMLGETFGPPSMMFLI